MWLTRVLSTEKPKQLVKALLFVLRLGRALRRGKKHHSLHSISFDSQFHIKRDAHGNVYVARRN